MALNPNTARICTCRCSPAGNAILEAMNRRYTVETYLQRVDSLRRAVPLLG